MLRYIIQRLLLLPFLILIFSIIVFGLVQAPPGDFLTSYIATLASSGSSMDQAQVDALKMQFGVDQPITVQYARWMGGLLQGDLGRSLEYQRPNGELIGERLILTVRWRSSPSSSPGRSRYPPASIRPRIQTPCLTIF